MMARTYSIVERILWLVAVSALPLFTFRGLPELDAASAKQAAAFRAVGAASPSPFSVPYFARLGARSLERFGDAEDAARVVSQVPAILAAAIVLFWTWRRFGWLSAASAAFLLIFSPWALFFGKTGPEAAFAVSATFVAIASYERYWRAQIGVPKRVGWTCAMLLGLALSGATLGFFGISLWSGTLLSLFAAFLLSERSFARLMGSLFTSPAGFLAAALVPTWYAWSLVSGDELPDAAVNAFRDAAASSHSAYFTGEWSFADWRPFDPLVIFAWENAYWLWTLPCAWVLLFTLKTRRGELPSKTLAWTANAIAFIGAAGLYASFRGREEAGMMMRAFIPLLVPLGGLFVASMVARIPGFARWPGPWLRWALVIAGFGVAWAARPRLSPDRLIARPFIAASTRLNQLPAECELWVTEGAVSESDMDAYGAWYFRGRPWFFSKKKIPSPIALPENRVFWDIETGEVMGRKGCGS